MLNSSFSARTLHRRSFFRLAGATAAASALVLAGCGKDDTVEPTPTTGLVSFGKADFGVLNYAYLLEQLEAAFYDKVVTTPPTDLLPGELALLTDIRDHELIHREYLRYALGSNAYDNGVAPLEFDFSSLTLTTRTGVWTAARQLENVGVAAYNGAAKLLTETGNLIALGKIVSMEARHAALAHEVLQSDSFASTVDANGLDAALTPAEVVVLIKPFLKVDVSTASLPTS